MNMKRLYLLSAFFAVSATFQYLNGQMAVVDYMRVPPGKEAGYIQIEKAWKAIHEVRKKAGKILSWNLYEVSFAGADAPYQYVTVTTYPRLAKYSEMDWNDFKGAMAGLDEEGMNQFFNKTNDARVLAKTSVYNRVVGVQKPSDRPTGVLVVNYMHIKPGGDETYLQAEKTVFRPVHEEDIRREHRQDWSLWQLQNGDLTSHQYVTIDAFLSLAQMDADRDQDAMLKKVHNGKDVSDLIRRSLLTREMRERQIWKWIDGVN
jgi:hypothetical protein